MAGTAKSRLTSRVSAATIGAPGDPSGSSAWSAPPRWRFSACSLSCRWWPCSPKRCGKAWGVSGELSAAGCVGRHPIDLAGRGDCRPAEHRVRSGGVVGHRQVRVSRQEPADHAHRSALCGVARDLGADLRAAVRAAGVVRAVAGGARHPDHFCRAGHRAGHDFRHLPLRRSRNDSPDARARDGGGRGGAGAGGRAAGRRSGESPCPTSNGPCCTA